MPDEEAFEVDVEEAAWGVSAVWDCGVGGGQKRNQLAEREEVREERGLR